MLFAIKFIIPIISFPLSLYYKKEKNKKMQWLLFMIGLLFTILSLLDIYAVYHDRNYPGDELTGFKDGVKRLFFP